jgi:hypothetical protein
MVPGQVSNRVDKEESMTTLTPERVKELKDMIDHDHESYLCDDDKADLFSILDDYVALKVENEDLRLQVKYPDPEDVPGELAKKFCPFNDELHFHHDGCPSEWATEERVKKTEAQLERQRPLIEAVMGAFVYDTIPPQFGVKEEDAILRAALKLRSEK